MNRSDGLPEAQWRVVTQLAHQLLNKGVSANYVRQAMTYTAKYPSSAALHNWLLRVGRLGDTFSSGKHTGEDRKTLSDILRPAIKDHPDWDWTLVLAWIARLMVATSRSEKGKR